MKGLELSKRYFESFGRPMLEKDFPELLPFLCAGLFGSGSECFGFDDDISKDHDFEPGFCLFLPDERIVDRRTAFLLERAYSKLPREFEGFSRPRLSPAGGARKGVFRTAEFFSEKIGTPDGVLTAKQWLTMPEQLLAETTNGEIFFDNFGEVTRIRNDLSYFPEDIRRKKLAEALLLSAQSGQYNFRRCLAHGEEAAAQLAAFEFVKNAAKAIFLLNKTYMPFYKWCFRSMRALPKLSLEAEIMEYLITTPNDEASAEEKYYAIEGIAADIIDELIDQKLSKAVCGDLEKHAYSVNDMIADPAIRNLDLIVSA